MDANFIVFFSFEFLVILTLFFIVGPPLVTPITAPPLPHTQHMTSGVVAPPVLPSSTATSGTGMSKRYKMSLHGRMCSFEDDLPLSNTGPMTTSLSPCPSPVSFK